MASSVSIISKCGSPKGSKLKLDHVMLRTVNSFLSDISFVNQSINNLFIPTTFSLINQWINQSIIQSSIRSFIHSNQALNHFNHPFSLYFLSALDNSRHFHFSFNYLDLSISSLYHCITYHFELYHSVYHSIYHFQHLV